MIITKEYCDNCGAEFSGVNSWFPVKIKFYVKNNWSSRRSFNDEWSWDREYKLCRNCYSNFRMNLRPEVEKALAEKDSIIKAKESDIEYCKEKYEKDVKNLKEEITKVKESKVNSVKYDEEQVEKAKKVLSRHCESCSFIDNYLTGSPSNPVRHWHCNKLDIDIPESPYNFYCKSHNPKDKSYVIYSGPNGELITEEEK